MAGADRADFEAYYARLFGARWPALREALVRPNRSCARLNPFVPDEETAVFRANASEVPGAPGCWQRDAPFPTPARGPSGLVGAYLMDAASVVAAEALATRDGDDVLDLCAAPGGKAWILASRLSGAGTLVANERSAARRARLLRVLADTLPREVRERVRVTGHDATRWSLHEKGAYDKILLDAPCSSERHVLAGEKARRDWSPARSRQLVRRQYAMLASALDVVRVGGRIVYATCALVPDENDGVVARLLADPRRADRARALPAKAAFGEPTQLGWRILPDDSGWGPLYFAVLERLA